MEAPNTTALERFGKEVGVEDPKGKTDIKIIYGGKGHESDFTILKRYKYWKTFN
jgi:hypothetical protein